MPMTTPVRRRFGAQEKTKMIDKTMPKSRHPKPPMPSAAVHDPQLIDDASPMSGGEVFMTTDGPTPSSSPVEGVLTFASKHPLLSLIVGIFLLGGFFSITNAIGLTHTDEDDVRSPSVGVSPAPSQRAWLSPDGSGGNCAWFSGVASDYGDPFTFCDYPAP